MNEEVNICFLDYLIGTLSTAYRGMITSLIAKQFCITEKDGRAVFKGEIISMPEGRYQICLLHGGIEMAREDIRDGYFELRTDISSIKNAGNLQLDVIQNGRHVGTFLLKKEAVGGMYVSAFEISQDLKRFNFEALGESLNKEEGLRKKAESVISMILSTKRDWGSLSETINSFSNDLFWYARDAFYLWHHLLFHFLFRACKNTDDHSSARVLSNALSIIELPLEKETDVSRLTPIVDTWIQEICASGINFFRRFRHTAGVLNLIYKRLPGFDAGPLIKRLLASLKTEIRSVPVIRDKIINVLKGYLNEEAVSRLALFSESSKKDFSRKIEELEGVISRQEPLSEILNKINTLDTSVLDSLDMVESFFSVLRKGIKDIDNRGFALILPEVSKLLAGLIKDIYNSAILNFKGLLKDLLYLDRTESCKMVLEVLSKTEINDDVFLNRETAELILKSGDLILINSYLDVLRSILIPPPKISGFSDETWSEISNPLHLKRLSGFLGVLSIDSEHLKDVLIHLICNLYVSGVFIPDERIFQREVSAYLNSGVIRKNFLFHYMLLKKLPVYFNEVGASGRIREFSTEIDSWGNDTVIYFLRKQIHVNASNNNIPIIESIIMAWTHNDADLLRDKVPEDVLADLKEDLLRSYSSVLKPLFKDLGILEGKEISFDKLLKVTDEEIRENLKKTEHPEEIGQKVLLLCRIYREVIKKYAFHVTESGGYSEPVIRLSELFDKLKKLQALFTSHEITEPQESLYFKRHIAFGIPSVIGSYHEPKFDALADAFRNEELVRLVLEEMLSRIETEGIRLTEESLKEWFLYIEKINDFFSFHGLENPQVMEIIAILKSNTLCLSQVIDLLRIWQRELTWSVELFYRTFHRQLSSILKNYHHDDLPDFLKKLDSHSGDFISRASDVIIRDMINSIAGFEELDRLLNSLVKSLSYIAKSQKDFKITLNGVKDAGEKLFVLHKLTLQEATQLAPALGSKAKNLVCLKDRGLPVPHGAVFSSAVTMFYEDYTESEEFRAELKKAVSIIERQTGSVFGGKENPLFLSVRSGSYISMPGILSSILYCGMNDDTMKGFIVTTGDALFACDSYKRFIEHYSSIVLKLEIGVFEKIQREVMNNFNVEKLQELNADGMKEIVNRYQSFLSDSGLEILANAYEQLRQSVKAIYGSWFGDKAVQFRQAMNVSEHWGTSVTLMQMIYGNRRGSGAVVFFTRNPLSLEKGIYGEMREASTGDDIVYGKLINRPLSRVQSADNDSLEEIDHELYHHYENISEEIEGSMGGLPQEVESAFVTEDGKRIIYILQTRRMEFRRGFAKKFHEICRMESSIIGRGVGMHGGALSGVVTFSVASEQIRALKEKTDQPVILLRNETSTEDVSVMPEIDGIVTSVGGATSHAAILSQKFDITAVVGCADLGIMRDSKDSPYAVIGNYKVREGGLLSIDGSTGLVYSGVCQFTVKRVR